MNESMKTPFESCSITTKSPYLWRRMITTQEDDDFWEHYEQREFDSCPACRDYRIFQRVDGWSRLEWALLTSYTLQENSQRNRGTKATTPTTASTATTATPRDTRRYLVIAKSWWYNFGIPIVSLGILWSPHSRRYQGIQKGYRSYTARYPLVSLDISRYLLLLPLYLFKNFIIFSIFISSSGIGRKLDRHSFYDTAIFLR